MTNAIMDSKLTLGTIVALVPVVAILFGIDSRYLVADEGREQMQEIRAEHKKAIEDVQYELDFNYSKIRIGLAEIRVERYQDKLDELLLLPELELHHEQQIQLLERGIFKYQEIIDRERGIIGTE